MKRKLTNSQIRAIKAKKAKTNARLAANLFCPMVKVKADIAVVNGKIIYEDTDSIFWEEDENKTGKNNK